MNRTTLWPVLIGLAAGIMAAPSAQAELLLTENFEYPAGKLYGQGEWMNQGTNNVNNPIQLVEPALTYPGYIDTPLGLSAEVAGADLANQRCVRMFRENGNGVNTGSVYVSALVSVKSAESKVYFFTLQAGTKAGFSDNKCTGSEIGRLYAYADGGKTYLAASKNSATLSTPYEIELNKTYLVVGKYTFIDGTNNDTWEVWVNPEMDTEGTPDMTGNAANADISASYGAVAVQLRQGSTATAVAPDVLVDGIRVATTWAELFGNQPVTPPDPPVGDAAIAVNPAEVDFGYTLQGTPVAGSVSVKGTGLTEAVAVSVSGDFGAEVTSISAADAAAGYTLNLTYKAAQAGDAAGTLTLSSAGAEDVTVALKGNATAVTSIPMASQIVNLPSSEDIMYRYTGKATVTYVDGTKVYAQDMTGALCLDFEWYGAPDIASGDIVTGVLCTLTKSMNVPYLMVLNPAVTKTGTGSKSPLEVSAAEVLSSPELYIHRLVTLSDQVVFDAVDEGATFSTTRRGTSGQTAVTVLPFAGTDLATTAVPEQATVTGIVRSMSIVSISPRSSADIAVPEEEPALDVVTEKLFESDEFGLVGQSKPFGRFSVNTTALKAPVQVYLTGANRDQFSIDVEEIPAGTGTTVVTLSYAPTAIGKHNCRINFDATPVELSTGAQFTAMAIDPDNLPEVTVDATGITDFVAAVGSTHEQALEVVTANAPDFGTARIIDASGNFRINSTTLLKSGTTRIVITYVPREEGEHSDVIEFSVPGGNSFMLHVSGSTDGGDKPQPKEGDDFPLHQGTPLTLMTEDFEGATERNKPLAFANGWKNIAVEGTRAWWGYNEEDGNHVAKVTAYDMLVPAGTENPCRMLLATPALDYKNAESRFFTFRVMGDLLAEGQTDLLEVCYMDMVEGDLYIEPIGLTLPATADYNKEWQDFVIDLDGLDLADTFYIGFRFTSNRGRDNSAVYYIDDVSWGRTDVAFIRPAERLHTNTVSPSADYVMEFSAEGVNLTEPIALKMVGSHAANFTLSAESLPKEGGEFSVTFNSDVEELHTGFVEMKSAGAPVSYIDMYITPDGSLGIENVAQSARALDYTLDGRMLRILSTDGPARVAVYDSTGRTVAASAETATLDLGHLPAGVYVLTASTSARTISAKIVLK
ncbi:MAG: T9SS type A sorting domain-containing protein [Muribaculaceae bacterium]|nr:T9SS type A sorting domain-containing protein [Muribaculaceae bacterium]